jgi:uncharacterized protein (DUF302 family)
MNGDGALRCSFAVPYRNRIRARRGRPVAAVVKREDAPMWTRRETIVGGIAAGLAVAATHSTGTNTHFVRGEEEPTMKPGDRADTDVVTIPSENDVTRTVERLKAVLAQKGIELFAHIDHAAAAKKVGLALRPTQVLILGNPKAGTPLMQSRQTIGLDLPLRMLVWEDEAGKVWLTYRRVASLAQQHHVTGQDETVKTLDDGLAGLARAATAR